MARSFRPPAYPRVSSHSQSHHAHTKLVPVCDSLGPKGIGCVPLSASSVLSRWSCSRSGEVSTLFRHVAKTCSLSLVCGWVGRGRGAGGNSDSITTK